MATITDYALAKFGSVAAGILCAAFHSCPGMFTIKDTHRLLETSTDVHKGILPRVMNLRKGPFSKSRLGYAVGNVKSPVRVAQLIEFGVDVSEVDWKGNNLLHDAVAGGSLDVVKAILMYHPELAAKPNSHGRLPAHEAILLYGVDPEILWELIAAYSESLYKTDIHGNTLLHCACEVFYRSGDIIPRLIEACPEALHHFNYNDETPIFVLLSAHPGLQLLEIITLLLKASPEIVYDENKDCLTPIEFTKKAYWSMKEENEFCHDYYDLTTQKAIIKKLRDAEELCNKRGDLPVW